ncbi:uncharacterized protein VTP21DRAFT_1811 [Calcarisporiella thermophila]|uniref:uncharacterized protein n=1 Tax=Calcarisporiella thermophila TaxID=911321 RepID=UPI0037443E56
MPQHTQLVPKSPLTVVYEDSDDSSDDFFSGTTTSRKPRTNTQRLAEFLATTGPELLNEPDPIPSKQSQKKRGIFFMRKQLSKRQVAAEERPFLPSPNPARPALSNSAYNTKNSLNGTAVNIGAKKHTPILTDYTPLSTTSPPARPPPPTVTPRLMKRDSSILAETIVSTTVTPGVLTVDTGNFSILDDVAAAGRILSPLSPPHSTMMQSAATDTSSGVLNHRNSMPGLNISIAQGVNGQGGQKFSRPLSNEGFHCANSGEIDAVSNSNIATRAAEAVGSKDPESANWRPEVGKGEGANNQPLDPDENALAERVRPYRSENESAQEGLGKEHVQHLEQSIRALPDKQGGEAARAESTSKTVTVRVRHVQTQTITVETHHKASQATTPWDLTSLSPTHHPPMFLIMQRSSLNLSTASTNTATTLTADDSIELLRPLPSPASTSADTLASKSQDLAAQLHETQLQLASHQRSRRRLLAAMRDSRDKFESLSALAYRKIRELIVERDQLKREVQELRERCGNLEGLVLEQLQRKEKQPLILAM